MTRPPRFLPVLFPGRRSLILVLAAAALVAVPLVLLLPGGAGAARVVTRGGGQLMTSGAPVKVGASPAVRFLTLNQGDVIDFSPGPVSVGRSQVLRRIGATETWRAVQAGGRVVVAVGKGKAQRTVQVFVSPVPSVQVGRVDLDWYRTQYGTGIANCGPALVSMAILFARGEDVPVERIREEIGWPYEDGATSLDDLRRSLRRHAVRFQGVQVAASTALFSLIDRGHIAFLLLQSGGISPAEGNVATNLVGRYYGDDEGHYVIVKGYSVDRRYLVVYDPYPVDWASNSLRYADGVTMIGKDRYYPVDEVFAALKTREAVEIVPGT
jgi:hypothetical protein